MSGPRSDQSDQRGLNERIKGIYRIIKATEISDSKIGAVRESYNQLLSKKKTSFDIYCFDGIVDSYPDLQSKKSKEISAWLSEKIGKEKLENIKRSFDEILLLITALLDQRLITAEEFDKQKSALISKTVSSVVSQIEMAKQEDLKSEIKDPQAAQVKVIQEQKIAQEGKQATDEDINASFMKLMGGSTTLFLLFFKVKPSDEGVALWKENLKLFQTSFKLLYQSGLLEGKFFELTPKGRFDCLSRLMTQGSGLPVFNQFLRGVEALGLARPFLSACFNHDEALIAELYEKDNKLASRYFPTVEAIEANLKKLSKLENDLNPFYKGLAHFLMNETSYFRVNQEERLGILNSATL